MIFKMCLLAGALLVVITGIEVSLAAPGNGLGKMDPDVPTHHVISIHYCMHVHSCPVVVTMHCILITYRLSIEFVTVIHTIVLPYSWVWCFVYTVVHLTKSCHCIKF